MSRIIRVSMVAVVAAALLAGVAYAAPRMVPPKQEQALVHTAADPLPGDAKALEQALKAHSEVHYRILTVDDAGEDKTDWLDRVAAEWGEPRPDTLLLVIFARDNYDIRFYMGANFRSQDVTVDEMLKMVRTFYFPKSQKGDVAGGLASLVTEVNWRMGMHMEFPSVDSRVTPEIREAITRWANEFLTYNMSQAQTDAMRLAAAGLDGLGVVENPDGLAYKVVFSVKPVLANSPWAAGSGTPGQDGWVNGKVKLVRVTNDNGELKVMSSTP